MTILVLLLALAAIWVWSLVDALRIPDESWASAGQNKLLWVLLIVFLGLLGSLLYVVMPRKTLVVRASGPAV